MNTLEDKDAIRELLAEYCFLLDSYRLKEFGQLFLESGEWVSRNGSAAGPAGIEQFMRQLVPEPGPGTRRKHFTANIVIRLNGDLAEVTSNFLVVRDTGAGPAIAVAGTYHRCRREKRRELALQVAAIDARHRRRERIETGRPLIPTATQRSLLSNATSVSRSLASSGASVCRVIASAFGATFSASC